MKHKLLSLLALSGAMFMSTSVWAQDEPTPSKWADPVKPTEPVREAFSGTWVTPEAGNSYYIYNVGAVQFMGAGRDWGTRTVTTNDSIVSPEGTKAVHNQSPSNTKNFALPYSIASEAEYFTLAPQNIDFTGFVTGEGNASWQDGTGDRVGKWQIVPVDGSEAEFLLHCANGGAYDATDLANDEAIDSWRLLGVCSIETNSYTWNDLKVGGFNSAGVSHKVNWKFIAATDDVAKSIRAWRVASQETLDAAMKIYNAALAVYNAKLALRDAMDAADAAGIDVTAAETVYLNENATEADILNAKTTLQLQSKLAGFSGEPIDITEVLQNPDFEVGNINGWETNYVSGKQAQNIGYQGASYTNGEITIAKFIESWLPGPATIGDGYLQQTIYGLPAGKYRLECDAIAVQQSNASATTTGAFLFIQAGTLESKTSMTSGNEAPEHFEVSFSHDGGKPLTFGMKTVSTSANWICADNFKLWYDGELTESPHYTQLQEYLAEINSSYSSTANLSAAIKTEMENAIEQAEAITKESSDDDCDAAYNALKEALDKVTASIKVYETLNTFIENGGKLAEYEQLTVDNGWDALSQILNNRRTELEDVYTNGTLSDEEVTAAISQVQPEIIEWVKAHPEALSVGNDLTILLMNADFSEGYYFAGWDAADDNPESYEKYGTLPGWTINSGNITQMKGGVIETYHRKFDFSQTISNMPAGVYDISVNGFVRHDGSETDQTIFFAGDLQTSLMERSDQWSATALYDPATMGDPCGGANGDQTITNSRGESVKVPNGMSGFFFWEQVENTEGGDQDYPGWKEGDKYYTNHIKATLIEAGDFVIGMKSLGALDWIIWDNFQIKYLGNGGDVFGEMAQEKFNELTKIYENETYSSYITQKATNDYETISNEDYSGISSLDDYTAFANRCDALIEYIKAGTKLGQSLEALLTEYASRELIAIDDNYGVGDFPATREEYSAKLEYKEFADNEALEAAPAALAKVWTASILESAEEGMFGNVTPIIFNPKYTSYADESVYNLNGWSMDKPSDITMGNYLANQGVAEVYNPKCTFKHYQKLTDLKPGYYRVTVDAYFRPGDTFVSEEHEAFAAIKRSFVFGETSSDYTATALIKNVLEGAQNEDKYTSSKTYTWTDETEGEITVYTPNDVASAAVAFNEVYAEAEETELQGEETDQSVYRNAITVLVPEDGVLTIGISNTGFEANDWTCFSNWTLSYMGTEVPDAVNGISEAVKTATAAIYTIDGRQASRLQRGLNIVRQSDGAVKKVLVK